MNFIVENYMWFIIGGIVILMAVVGYIADITDFGRNRIEKEPKEKIEKPKKEKVKKEKIKKEKPKKDKVVQEVSLESTNELENPIEVNNEISSEINNELPMDEFQNIQEQEMVFDQSNTDLESTMFSNEVNEMGNNLEDETVDQSLFEPLPSVDQVFQTANKPADDYIAPVTEETTEESEVASDDDIWKF